MENSADIGNLPPAHPAQNTNSQPAKPHPGQQPIKRGLTESEAKSVGLRLFVLGFQVLFLELALIRYLAGYIWNLGYFPNLVLLAAFIGFGFGFLLHRHITNFASGVLYGLMPIFFLIFIVIVFVENPSAIIGNDSYSKIDIGGDLYFTSYGNPDEPIIAQLVKFLLWFFGVVAIFFFIGQYMAKLFRLLPPLKAYMLDISGSLAGIMLFMAISFFQIPSVFWFLIVAVSFWIASGKDFRPLFRVIATMGFVIVSAISIVLDNPYQVSKALEMAPAGEIHDRVGFDEDASIELWSTWSPYQRLTLLEKHRYFEILANGLGHQLFGNMTGADHILYNSPHEARRKAGGEKFDDILIIGSGSGNDVAAALRYNAKDIDAVEIDPGILEYGYFDVGETRTSYADDRVNAIVDDGRHFLHETDKKYDLIVFALTDSLVRVSSIAQLRLENYLFTLESFRLASTRLKPGGWIVLYNNYRRGLACHKTIANACQSHASRIRSLVQAGYPRFKLANDTGRFPIWGTQFQQRISFRRINL